MPDKNIQLPDGRVVAFPDSMADTDIAAAIQKQMPATQQPTGSAVAQNMQQIPTDPEHPYMSAMAQEGMADVNEALAKNEFSKQHPWINAIGDILSTAVVPSGEAIAEAIPSTLRSGAALNKVAQAVGPEKLPVPSYVSDAANEAAKLASQGGQQPKVLKDFLEWATNPDKGIAWADLRRFQSAAGKRVFLDDNSQIIKDAPMLRAMGKFYGSLRDWATDVADSKGVLEPFEQGMKEYGRAKGLKDAARFAAKTVVPSTPGGAAARLGTLGTLYTGYQMGKAALSKISDMMNP